MLGTIVTSLDVTGLRVEVEGPSLAEPPGEIVVHDPLDRETARAGAVLLAVGVAPDASAALALLDAQRPSTIVFRTADPLPRRMADLARSLGVTVLSAPPELTWGQLHALLRSGPAPQDADATGDLFALADAIAAAVGGPVTIEDPQWRILAFSNLDQPIDEARRQTILGRSPPEEWQRRIEEAGVLQALRTGDRPVRFAAPQIATRLAAPVRAGAELLGSIWVAETAEPFGDAAEAELQHAAHAAAIHLLVHRAAGDVERRHRAAFVRDALAGRRAGERPVRAVCFAPADVEAIERVLSVVGLYVDGLGRAATCAVVDDAIWAIAPADAQLGDVARRVVERVERLLGVTVRAAVGAAVPELADLPRSRRTAELALAASAAAVVAYEDVRATCTLDELLDLAGRESVLGGGRIAALAEHDRRHGTQLCLTLRAWLHTRDLRAAAARLGVHPNTMRHRLRKAQEICGLDPADADERLLAELQLRALSRA